jgi:MFS transporter, YNFM family, putative membrane transport protein
MVDPSKDLTRRLRLLGLASFASMASMRWCDALLPVLSAEFASTAGQTSAVVYGFALAYGVMQLVYGPIGDRLGKDRVVSLAALACTVGALASALAPSLGWLIAARVLTGATAAGVIPLTMAWIGDQVPWDQRQPVLARYLGATMGGMIAGQWLSGVFADALGWRAGFVAVALLFAIAGLAMRLSFRGSAGSTAGPAAGSPAVATAAVPVSSLQRMREVLASRQARLVLVIVAVEGAFAAPAMAFAPSHLHGRFGLAVSTAGAIVTLFGAGGLMYSKGARWMLTRTDPLSMARAGGLMAGAAWVLFAWAPAIAWTLPLCVLAGLGFYMIHNTLQTQATQMAPTQRGTGVSLFACSLFLGQSLGMSAASWLVDQSSTTAVLTAYGLGLALVGVVMVRMPLAAQDTPQAVVRQT